MSEFIPAGSDQMRAHRRVQARRRKRILEMHARLMLNALKRVGCQFPIGCPGPNEPYLTMGTCFVCDAIARAEGRPR